MKTSVPCMLFAAVFAIPAAVALADVALADPVDAAPERDGNATHVAKAWFMSLMQGETAVTTSLSEVPFAFDKKQEVQTHSNLKQLYDQVVARKGKRNLKPTSVKIKSSSTEKVEVVLMIEDEGIIVAVRPGEVFRVVGFAD